MRILLTGGSGRLGTDIRVNIKCLAPTKKQLDITTRESIYAYCLSNSPNLIVHAAAYTDVSKANSNKRECWEINVEGTRNIVEVANMLEIPVIYISTDYVFDGNRGNYSEEDIPYPVKDNFYAFSKYIGEVIASSIDRNKVIRTSFKPSKWEYDMAFTDVYTSADYVDVIAREISLFIENYHRIIPKIMHIATEKKSIYNLAKRRNDKVKEGSRKDIKDVNIPKDVSLNVSKWIKIKSKL